MQNKTNPINKKPLEVERTHEFSIKNHNSHFWTFYPKNAFTQQDRSQQFYEFFIILIIADRFILSVSV